MFNCSKTESAIAFGGFGLGLVAGSINNYRQTWSLRGVGSKPWSPSNNFVVKWLENDRENFVRRLRSPWDLLLPKLWNPFIQFEQLVPLALVGTIHVISQARLPGATSWGVLGKASVFTFKVMILPLFYYNICFMGAGKLRMSRPVVALKNKLRIDPSGHCAEQAGMALYKVFAFSALANLGISPGLYLGTAAVTSLSDFLWTHRTVSSYHSILDMVVVSVLSAACAGGLFAVRFGVIKGVSVALPLLGKA